MGIEAMFGGPQAPATPKVEPPPRMPDPDDPAARAAQRRTRMEAAARGGRASTLLTRPAAKPLGAPGPSPAAPRPAAPGTLASGAYSSTTLGGV